MNPPQSVKYAITAVWICIGLSVIAALLDRLTSRISVGDFVTYIILYALYVIIPYKLMKRSNASRFVFAVLEVISVLLWVGGAVGAVPLFTKISAIIQIPISAIAIYWLFFTADAKNWFEDRNDRHGGEATNNRN